MIYALPDRFLALVATIRTLVVKMPALRATVTAMSTQQFGLGLAILVAGGLLIFAGGWTWFRRPNQAT